MRLFLLIILLSGISFSFAQNAKTTFRYVRYEKVDDMKTIQHSYDDLGCDDRNANGRKEEIVLVEVAPVDPEWEDQKKALIIEQLELDFKDLKVYANCPDTKVIVIRLGEGLFLKKSDGFAPYSSRYYKRGYRVNAKRFWKHFQPTFQEILPGKQIILTDWGW
ncbi:MAG: hypothetical protein EP338_05180 [Bacteroidetes bacterium]|nr:MAG: hypothetical protein EP338_05180 [Bacteroidota bacterium]